MRRGGVAREYRVSSGGVAKRSRARRRGVARENWAVKGGVDTGSKCGLSVWLVHVGVLSENAGHGKTQSTWSVPQLPKSQPETSLAPSSRIPTSHGKAVFQAEFQIFMATFTEITEKRQRLVLMS